ncbi:MAG: bifunctional hydroxymethylpyrimidine kinase/phosphomethylpyrimidine kinase [Bdellovibrionales bacterium]|nr:bifunctional hydroxymethylpyrimidine kinase/phosphomethylpyrimidine kinase [Oligoflexia bacterium]
MNTIKERPILTVGSMAFDSVSTPFGKADRVLGGSANYFSLAASLFTPIKICAVVGDDFPKDHLDFLSTRNIDVSGVQIAAGKTFHWVGEYDTNLNEATTLATQLNVFEHFDPKLPAAHTACPIVFLANIDPVLQQQVLNQVKDHELVAMDSMNFWIMGKPAELKETLKRVDLLCINEKEAFLLSGEKSLEKAAKKIQAMGPSNVIIKRGEYGSAVFTPGGIFLAPAYLVDEVIDPTGAGDSFAGAVVGYLAETGASRRMMKDDSKAWDQLIRRAVVYGTVMASFTIQDFSIKRLKTLTREELVHRKERFLKMLSIGQF